MTTQNINPVYTILTNATDEQLEALYRECNSWDGSFPECVFYTIEDLSELYYSAEKELLYMLRDQKLDLASEYFYNDDVYWYNGCEEQKHDNFMFNLDDLVDYLVDNATTCAYPDYGTWDELNEAVAEQLDIEVDDL